MPVRLRVQAEGFDRVRGVVRGQRNRALSVIRNVSPLVLAYLREGIGEYFRQQRGPDGPWKALEDFTVAKKGHTRILFETGRLEASLTGRTPDSIVDVTRLSLRYGTRLNYAWCHEARKSNLPRRGFMPYGNQIDEFTLRRCAEHVLKYPPGSLGGPIGFQPRGN